MNIYIIGSGAIGKALAVALCLQQKKVTLIRGSVDNGAAYTEHIHMETATGDRYEAAVPVSTLRNFDRLNGVVVLTNKSYGNASLALSLQNKAAASPIILLQNGLGVEQPFIGQGYPHIYRCVLFVTSQTTGDSHVRFKPVSPCPAGIVKGDDATLQAVVTALHSDLFPFRTEAHIDTIVWKKAVINCVFNSVCPLLDTDNGIFHRNEAALAIARRIIGECLAVARKKGVWLEADEVVDNLLQISRSSDGQLISTLQDIRAGRPTEIDTLNLEVARMAGGMHMAEVVRETRLLGELTKLKSEL